jgi:hypothetical protein
MPPARRSYDASRRTALATMLAEDLTQASRGSSCRPPRRRRSPPPGAGPRHGRGGRCSGSRATARCSCGGTSARRAAARCVRFRDLLRAHRAGHARRWRRGSRSQSTGRLNHGEGLLAGGRRNADIPHMVVIGDGVDVGWWSRDFEHFAHFLSES